MLCMFRLCKIMKIWGALLLTYFVACLCLESSDALSKPQKAASASARVLLQQPQQSTRSAPVQPQQQQQAAGQRAPACKVSIPPGSAAVRDVQLSAGCPVNSNGCSGPADVIPFITQLTPACHAHDWCLSCARLAGLPVSKEGRLACDARFLSILQAICQEKLNGQQRDLDLCMATAVAMHTAVIQFLGDRALNTEDPCPGEAYKLGYLPFGINLLYSSGDLVVAEVTPGNGASWGAWQGLAHCPSGSWMSGLSTKVQPAQGFWRDDSGLVSIAATCTTWAGQAVAAAIKSYEGAEGGVWSSMQRCLPGQHVVGFRLRVQPPQGALRDDIAADAVEFKCSDLRSVLNTPNPLGLGEWSDWRLCPADAALCSFRIRYEQDSVLDNTAMGDLEVGCCRRVPPAAAAAVKPAAAKPAAAG